MVHVTQSGVLTIQDPVTGEWREIEPVMEPPFQVTITSPLRADPQEIACKARQRCVKVSPKRLWSLVRPKGFSQSHWRKVQRERRASR